MSYCIDIPGWRVFLNVEVFLPGLPESSLLCILNTFALITQTPRTETILGRSQIIGCLENLTHRTQWSHSEFEVKLLGCLRIGNASQIFRQTNFSLIHISSNKEWTPSSSEKYPSINIQVLSTHKCYFLNQSCSIFPPPSMNVKRAQFSALKFFISPFVRSSWDIHLVLWP